MTQNQLENLKCGKAESKSRPYIIPFVIKNNTDRSASRKILRKNPENSKTLLDNRFKYRNQEVPT